MPSAMSLRAVNAYWSLTAVQLTSIAALCGMCLTLIPAYGLQGCVIASLIGFALDGAGRSLLHHVLIRRPLASAASTSIARRAA
jgi:hypothetical protein